MTQYFGRFLTIPLVFLLLLAGGRNPAPREVSAYLAPDSSRWQKALESFQLEPGLRIELIAAEPLVVDPVALAFDENYQMYVVEDRGYPDPAEGGAPDRLGRVALLTDTDGDGKYDHRSEFVTGLTYPNGLLPWKGGVFVTCAPDIYYFKDTNGDGVADVKQVVLTGFSDSRTGQLRVSHPTLGPDGMVYVTSGLNSGEVRSPLHPSRSAVAYSPADGRFDPETFAFETTGGRSQFGLTFDAFGRRFGCSNRHPVQQIVLEPQQLRRNPNLLFTETIQDVSRAEAEATVHPISGAITSADFIPKLMGLSHTGTFTAASGVMVYNGSGLTAAHQGNAFICESAQNLVQRQVVRPAGVSFQSAPADEGREFLASTDEWFRPVFLQHGPEGALYLADMHRKVIDHPSYVPEEARPRLDFESGKTDGRIYRIVREDFIDKTLSYGQKTAFDSPVKLVQALQSPEEWERRTAHRLLLEQRNPSAISLLKKVVADAKFPESRGLALWLLWGSEDLDAATLRRALTDKETGVREQAVTLAGALAKTQPELLPLLTATAADPAMRVRFNGALALGSLAGEGVVPALAKIAAKDGGDRWARAAVLSGIGDRLPEFLQEFRRQPQPDPVAFSAVMQDLGQLFGNGAALADCRALLKEMLTAKGDYEWRIATMLGLAEGVSRRAASESASPKKLLAILGDDPAVPEKQSLSHFIAQTSRRAADPGLSARSRGTAAALLGYTDYGQSHQTLQELTDARHPPELQLAAIVALTRLGDARGATFLTQKDIWSHYTPQVKSAVVAAMVSKPAFTEVLFAAIRRGVIGAAEITSMDRQRLMKSKDPKISTSAEELFRELEGGGRMKIYQDYKTILSQTADAGAGKVVFERSCSACHTYAGKGGQVGPDLTGVRNQPADALLLHILVPNYEVLPAYQAIAVETNDGRSLSGWLLAETDNGLTLKTAFGTEEAVLRKNIKTLSNSGLSLMPEGLEQTMTRDELAELIAFLKQGSQ
ncbi:PVC-type heme-binding CxxCH protein [Persicitalea sp.]|uniref:PVC-type heme-binding CxxCH protein n=1 Tax=Persicitalea sp. TaxID=3100273 RepID=UPI00359413F7